MRGGLLDFFTTMIRAGDFLQDKTAVVFDFDGTLADTIGLWNAVDVRLAAELGYPDADPVKMHAFRENSLRAHRNDENPYRSYCGDFGKKIGCELSAQEIHSRRYQISRSMLRQDVRLRQGAAALLKRLKGMGLRMAVATTTRRANIEIYCRDNEWIRSEIHLEDIFEGFVCAEDVERIKPDPQCYLKALALLDVEPQQAFAVEDTLAGVQAARAAGLQCIGIAEAHSIGQIDDIKSRTSCYFEDYATFSSWLG